MKIPRMILRNRNWKTRSIQILNHVLVFIFISHAKPSLLLVSFIIYFFMFSFGISIGAHRLFSHRSFKTSQAMESLLSFLFNISTVGSLISWVSMHKEHHLFSDKQQDPHSPIYQGTFFQKLKKAVTVYFGFWGKYHAKPEFSCGLRQVKLHRLTHQYYFLSILIYVSILFIMDPILVIFAYCLPATLVFHSASFIVTLGHLHGHQSHKTDDQSKDSFSLHLITFGDGLHNLHHAKPSVYWHRNVSWYMYDLPGFIIHNFFIKSK